MDPERFPYQPKEIPEHGWTTRGLFHGHLAWNNNHLDYLSVANVVVKYNHNETRSTETGQPEINSWHDQADSQTPPQGELDGEAQQEADEAETTTAQYGSGLR